MNKFIRKFSAHTNFNYENILYVYSFKNTNYFVSYTLLYNMINILIPNDDIKNRTSDDLIQYIIFFLINKKKKNFVFSPICFKKTSITLDDITINKIINYFFLSSKINKIFPNDLSKLITLNIIKKKDKYYPHINNTIDKYLIHLKYYDNNCSLYIDFSKLAKYEIISGLTCSFYRYLTNKPKKCFYASAFSEIMTKKLKNKRFYIYIIYLLFDDMWDSLITSNDKSLTLKIRQYDSNKSKLAELNDEILKYLEIKKYNFIFSNENLIKELKRRYNTYSTGEITHLSIIRIKSLYRKIFKKNKPLNNKEYKKFFIKKFPILNEFIQTYENSNDLNTIISTFKKAIISIQTSLEMCNIIKIEQLAYYNKYFDNFYERNIKISFEKII